MISRLPPKIRGWVVATAGIFVVVLASCSKPATIAPATSKVYAQLEMPPGVRGDSWYAEVNHDWVKPFHEAWWNEMFKRGVKYNTRFDCNKFSAKFVADAQIEYYVQNFHSWTQGQALALSVVYYSPQAVIDAVRKGRSGQIVQVQNTNSYFMEDGAARVEWFPTGHALVEVRTQNGTEYFEPQPPGRWVKLTEDEKMSIFARAY